MAGAIYYPVTQVISRTSNSKTNTYTRSTTRASKTQDLTVHLLTDDGDGTLGPFGTVNYVGKTVNVRLVDLSSKTEGYKSDYENASVFETVTYTGSGPGGGSSSQKGGEYEDVSVSEEVLAGSTVSVTYATTLASTTNETTIFTPEGVTIDLVPYTADYIVPGSVRFTWMGHVFEDYEGVLIRDRDLGAGQPGFDAGTVNYEAGVAVVTDWVVDGDVEDFVLESCWTVRHNWTTASVFMRTQAAPVAPSGFVMNLSDAEGNNMVVNADGDGYLTGIGVRGRIEYQTGVVEMQFGEFVDDDSLTDAEKAEWWYDAGDVGAVEAGKIWKPHPVDPTTLRYNSVTWFYLPIDAALLGVDPVRLPSDGRVPIFRPGGFAVVGNTGKITDTVSNSDVIDCGRTRLSRIKVIGDDGVEITTGYTEDLEAGTVTFTDVSGYSQPVTIEHRIEDMVVVSDVQINGTLGFTRQLTHDYSAPGSYVSSALVSADLRSRVSLLFDQASWDGTTWSDTQSGSAATGTYNDLLYPIEVTNIGAVTERWALRFTSSSAFQIIGEHVGVIGTGSINSETAPINPATSEPYFVINEAGWGTGWATGNVVRFNTVGALYPFWMVRTVQQGAEGDGDYQFSILLRGDVDKP